MVKVSRLVGALALAAVCVAFTSESSADLEPLQSGTFTVTATAQWEHGDTHEGCCEALSHNQSLCDVAVIRACKAQNAVQVGRTRWSVQPNCRSEPNPGGGYKLRCQALAEGTCRR